MPCNAYLRALTATWIGIATINTVVAGEDVATVLLNQRSNHVAAELRQDRREHAMLSSQICRPTAQHDDPPAALSSVVANRPRDWLNWRPRNRRAVQQELDFVEKSLSQLQAIEESERQANNQLNRAISILHEIIRRHPDTNAAATSKRMLRAGDLHQPTDIGAPKSRTPAERNPQQSALTMEATSTPYAAYIAVERTSSHCCVSALERDYGQDFVCFVAATQDAGRKVLLAPASSFL